MRCLRRRILGLNGNDYVKDRLRFGRSLSSELSRIDFALGASYAFVPVDWDPTRVLRFHEGGLTDALKACAPNSASARVRTAEALSEMAARSGPEAAVLIEDQNADATDVSLQPNEGNGYIVVGNDVVVCIRPPINPHRIARGMLEVSAWLEVVAVVSNIGRRSLPVHLTRQELARVVRSTRLMAVSAYDGEGFVCWESRAPNSRSPTRP